MMDIRAPAISRVTVPARKPLRSIRCFLQTTPGRPIRRAIARGASAYVEWIPSVLRRGLELEGDPVRPLRVEVGGGAFPTPGYLHVDISPRARHLEYVAPAWRLPFATASVAELLAVHVLEHVHPSAVQRTLREWRRVLRPTGYVQLHVPNAEAIFREYLDGTPGWKWALIGSGLFGMYGGPSVRAGEDLNVRAHQPDHKAIYDFALIEHELLRAGFARAENVTERVRDRHTEAWGFPISLVVRAYAAPSSVMSG
jgi:SAM-dependent methyltransferase